MSDHYDPNQFSPRAQQVMLLAEREARRLTNNFIGTEHILLGIVKLGEESTTARILNGLGVTPLEIHTALDKQMQQGSFGENKGTPLTPRSKKVLSLADKERKALSHQYIGTEHLLLGLLREGDGLAARVLKSLKLTADVAREKLNEMLGQTPEAQAKDETAHENALISARELLEKEMPITQDSHVVSVKLRNIRSISIPATPDASVQITPRVLASLLAAHTHASSPEQEEDLLLRILTDLRKESAKA